MKKILVLGSNSFTGHYICRYLGDEFKIIKSNRRGIDAELQFDVDTDNIARLEGVAAGADIIINCISNGDLDSCESDPLYCKRVNYDLVEKLCLLQQAHDFHLIHFSSNAVYDGENALYAEDSQANAINQYGEIKIKADQFIEQNIEKYTILRPITMYGLKLKQQRHNPFSFFYQQLLENKDIVAVDDVFVNMLHVTDLIRCIKSVITHQNYGSYNISGDDVVNRYEFVSMIKALIPDSRSCIKPVTSDKFKTLAKRPKNTSFDNSIMKNHLGVCPEKLGTTLQRLVSYTH